MIETKRTTRIKLNSAAVAIAISIPLITAAYKSHEVKADPNARDLTQAEIEAEIAKNNAEMVADTEPVTEVFTEDVKVPEIEPQSATEASFEGYDFIPLSTDLQVNIFTLCEQYEISYNLILAVIKTESEFQWLIGDDGNATGYMQIWKMYWQETADAYGLNIDDPLDNVHLGIIIITSHLNECGGDLDKALTKYNSGNPTMAGNTYAATVYENIQWIEGNKYE